MSGMDVTLRERLIVTIASLLDGARHVAEGASSPIPAAAARGRSMAWMITPS